MREELEKFGKVEIMCQSVYNYEFKITAGFSGKANDTFKLMKLCIEEAEGYKNVSECKTDKNLFHLILSKK